VLATVGRLAARYGLLVPLLGGAALLIAAEFFTLWEIRVLTTVPEDGTATGGAHHGYALLVIGLALIPMSLGAVLGGSRPAAVACLVLSLGAAGVVVFVDLPDVSETGLIGETYEAAVARPQTGFYLESLGATLAVVGSVATLVFGWGRGGSRPRRPRRERPPRRRDAQAASEGTPGPRPSSSESSRSVEGNRSASP
jgi:hypothetical protein